MSKRKYAIHQDENFGKPNLKAFHSNKFKQILKLRSVNFKMSFWYLQFSQKTKEKKIDFTTSSGIVFVCFFGELKTPKRHFEINRPLGTMHFIIGSGFKILTKTLLHEMDVPYGNTGCGVFKWGVQN